VRERVFSKLTYANVVSSLALFLVLTGGVVWAAGQIGSGDIANNAVRSRHIKAGNVHASDIGTGAVSSRAVKNGSLTTADLNSSALQGGGGAVFATVSGLGSGAGTQFAKLSGPSAASSLNTTDAADIAPAGGMTVKDIGVITGQLLPSGTSRTFALSVSGSPTALACTITAGDNGCEDINSVHVPGGANVGVQIDSSGARPERRYRQDVVHGLDAVAAVSRPIT
jgi:hypothetical protein